MDSKKKTNEPDHCVFERLARIMDEEPAIEAVQWDKGAHDVAVATLGSVRDEELVKQITEAVGESAKECSALRPDAPCSACRGDIASRIGLGKEVRTQPDGAVVLRRLTCPTAPSLYRWRKIAVPTFITREVPEIAPAEEAHEEWPKLALLSAICLVALVAGFVAQKLGAPQIWSVGLFAVACVAGGWDAAIETWEMIWKGRLDVHFLMLAVAAGAASIGAWGEGALLLFLFSASGAMEHYAMGRTRKEIGALLRGAPKTATLVEGDSEREVPVDTLAAEMRVRVKAGALVPVDMEVDRGESACDESNLTGESRPIPKAKGDTALAGTLNTWGVIEGRVLRPASESALSKIIRLIQDAQHLKAPSQRFSDRFGTGYTYSILGLCAVMFLVWWLGFHLPPFVSGPHLKSAFYRAMTLLVVASPCALVLSVPSAILSAIAFGARRGVLFRGGTAIETLADVQIVAFDKTGTLTAGDLSLGEFQVLEGQEHAAREIAWNLARLSDHPLSRAIKRAGAAWDCQKLDVDSIESVAGKGIRGGIEGRRCVLGSARFVAEFLGRPVEESGHALETAEVWVAGTGVLARMQFRDQLRPEAAGLLAELRRQKIETVMLTGDRRAIAGKIAEEAGVGRVEAELLPEQKVEMVQRLKQGGKKVAMVGDGVNDAPVLAAADVGVAMGMHGSDAALEQAEVVLMNDRLENFLLALHLSVRARGVIRQNIAIALGTVVVMVITSMGTAVPLALGVAAHEGSTLLVVLNSLRLLFGEGIVKGETK